MIKSKQRLIHQTNLLQALAEFRYHLRSFLQFSEQIAKKKHLHPRQHQLLLQIAGITEGCSATINFLAERLGLRQNSVVELANRSVSEGLVQRGEDPYDRRRVILSVTPKGMRVLDSLSASHARELDEFGPGLIRTLEHIKTVRGKKGDALTTGRPQTARKPAGPRLRRLR
ncbi:MAG TPA: MarR family transcriptional regulator [Acidobacteriaceae bacterium]|jgi:DNA-binding MarR family transcriptional regulator|nr:MarR family transcriptional regulator [Acidobacteriaceae bacterium]